MDCETKSSIQKLRKLREELCSKQSQWKNAFAIKDAVVDELKVLKIYACDPDCNREDLVNKIDDLLILIDPDRQKDLGACNE